jgi:hypothetical protein
LNPGFKAGLLHGGIRFGPGSVAVWELTLADELRQCEELQVIVTRKDGFHRQRAQGGVFTRLNHRKHLDLESYLKDRGLGGLLVGYEIAGGEMMKALGDLRRMNICFATLFPDLDGAAKQANLFPPLDTFD